MPIKDFNKIQRISLYIFLFSINYDMWDLSGGAVFSITKLTGIIYVLSIAPQLKWYLNPVNITQYLRPLIILFGLLTILILINQNYYNKTIIDFSLLQNIILFWIILNHIRKQPDIMTKGLLSYGFGGITLAIIYYLGIGISIKQGRVSIFGENENAIGLTMCIGLIIMIYYVVNKNILLKKYKILISFLIITMFILMLKTGSRVAILSFFLAIISMITLLRSKNFKNKIFLFIITSVIFYMLWQYIIVDTMLMNRIILTYENGNIAGREIIWMKVFSIMKNNPIFGVGQTGYELYSEYLFGRARSPHNVFLEIMCYTGVVGLLFFLVFIYRSIKSAILYYKSTYDSLALLLCIPMLGILLSGQMLNRKICWVIFAYIIGVFLFKPNKNQISTSVTYKK